ncbi:MAG: hypothetical protein KDI79_24955 [Anaerolineae bacterium]|nr:hypothetical protein [Anaerolineae bacterium]
MDSKDELSGQDRDESSTHQSQSEEHNNYIQEVFDREREELMDRLRQEQEQRTPSQAGGPEDMEGYWFASEVLSPAAYHFFDLLLGDQGDRDLLPIYAKRRGLDLDSSLDELRCWDLLDESGEKNYRIKLTELKE